MSGTYTAKAVPVSRDKLATLTKIPEVIRLLENLQQDSVMLADAATLNGTTIEQAAGVAEAAQSIAARARSIAERATSALEAISVEVRTARSPNIVALERRVAALESIYLTSRK